MAFLLYLYLRMPVSSGLPIFPWHFYAQIQGLLCPFPYAAQDLVWQETPLFAVFILFIVLKEILDTGRILDKEKMT